MKEDTGRKLQSLKNIIPSQENESMIRNLCHTLLCEVRSQNIENEFSKKIEKECYKILNSLEREKIISLPCEKFMPFYKYDLPLLVKNAVCASEIFLSSPKHVFSYSSYFPLYAVCSERLITRVICEEIIYFYTKYRYASVIFSAEKKRSRILLSVKATVNNQKNKINEEKIFSVLRKTAYIHSGTFLVRKNENNKEEHYLSINTRSKDMEVKCRGIPSYIDMLSDKTSSIYIILGSAF